MSYTEVFIASHGEEKNVGLGVQLTAAGRRQAMELGKDWHGQGLKPTRADASTSIHWKPRTL